MNENLNENKAQVNYFRIGLEFIKGVTVAVFKVLNVLKSAGSSMKGPESHFRSPEPLLAKNDFSKLSGFWKFSRFRPEVGVLIKFIGISDQKYPF